jgi:cytochrome c2
MIERPTSRPARILTLVAIIGLLAMPVAAATQSTSRFPGNPTLGQQLFSERGCVRCHSIWGTGGKLGPDLGEVGLGRSLMQLAGMFWNHTPRMIETVQSRGFEWPVFAESDLADVISFIYYVKLFDPPGNPELGAQWFSEKRCRECHSVGSNGGAVAAPLDSYARFIASLPLAAGMWNHGKAMRGVQAAKGVPVPQFYGGELADIQAFIRETSTLRGRTISLLPPPDLARGERLFRDKGCTACHGTTGRGTARAPDLSTAIQHLRASEIAGELWNHSARITEAMERSGITLPQFEGSELADVIAYLYYLRYEEMAGDVRAGRALFGAKGCASCHFLDGTPSIGPDLTQSAVVSNPVSLTTAMWNHAPVMYSRVQQAGIPWPLFQGNEMRDLAAFLGTLRVGGR